MYQQFKIVINVPTLVMHNGQTADPLNKYAKAMKAISSNRKKTDSDLEAMALIEYEAGLYLNGDAQVILPSRVFEAMIAEGARKSKDGKTALASTFVDNDAVISYEGGPLTVEELKASDRHRLSVPVRVGQSKVIRTRPIFHDVHADFLVSLQTELANASQLRRWIVDGLTQVGLGDWRPRYGRGVLERFEEVKVPLAHAA